MKLRKQFRKWCNGRGNLVPRIYATKKEALNAPDWRALNYVMKYDKGWIAVYVGERWMKEGSQALIPKEHFRPSTIYRNHTKVVLTYPMYDSFYDDDIHYKPYWHPNKEDYERYERFRSG